MLLDAALQDEMVRRTAAAMKPLADAGKLGAYLLQLTPGVRSAPQRARRARAGHRGPGPRAGGRRVQAPQLGLARLEGVLDWLSANDAVFVCVDTPPGDRVPIFPPIDAVTNEALAYMRCHGRNTEGYLHGRSVAERFDYDYSKDELEEIAGRARALDADAEQVHAMFNNNARELAPKARAAAHDPGPGSGAGALAPGGPSKTGEATPGG